MEVAERDLPDGRSGRAERVDRSRTSTGGRSDGALSRHAEPPRGECDQQRVGVARGGDRQRKKLTLVPRFGQAIESSSTASAQTKVKHARVFQSSRASTVTARGVPSTFKFVRST